MAGCSPLVFFATASLAASATSFSVGSYCRRRRTKFGVSAGVNSPSRSRCCDSGTSTFLLSLGATDDSDCDSGDGNAVSVALTGEEGCAGNDELRAALAGHPTVGMMGIELDLRVIPCGVGGNGNSNGEVENEKSDVVDFTVEQLSDIDRVDVACFGSLGSITAWLRNVDVARGFVDMDDEEKKKLGPDGNGNVVASCVDKDLAKECLGTGRWEARNIYYPASEGEEEDGTAAWADSAAQAIGDVLERKFWGGGW